MRWLALACLLAAGAAAGCFNPYGELLAEHISPNGFVRVSVDNAAQKASTGLGAAKAEPLNINGFSMDLTFGLVAGDDQLGSTALVAVSKPSTTAELKLTPATRTQLQVHTGGSGCKATMGLIKLTSDANAKHISGEFNATGVRVSDMTTPCMITGTLTDIPIER
jgi:hypothetical protein